MENALRAFSTTLTNSFARRSRASAQQESAKTLKRSKNPAALVYYSSYVEEGDNDHQRKQDGHANKVDNTFTFGFEAFATA